MTGKLFSTREALSFGWETMKPRMGFLIGVTILAIVIQWIPGGIARFLETQAGGLAVLAWIFNLAEMYFGVMMTLGLTRIMLKLHDGMEAGVEDLIMPPKMVLIGVGAAILSWLALVAGWILLIIPGLILMVRLYFIFCLIVDQGRGPVEAMKASFDLTRGRTWDLMVFFGLMFLVNMLGLMCLVMGLLVTVPLTSLATIYVYRRLAAAPDGPVDAIVTGTA